MKITILPQGTMAIYEQIVNQLKNEIVTGELTPGEALPSIRMLAADLSVSVITTKRAYEELEKEGFIYTVPAKGCYVSAKNTELIREANLRKIEDHMDEITKLAVSCNLSRNELIEMLDFSLEENRK